MGKKFRHPIDWAGTLRSLRELGAEERVERRTKPPHLGDGTEWPVMVWRITDPVGKGYDELVVFPDGTVVATTTWGSEDWWDRWVIFPDGKVEYCGTVDGPRYLPSWLVLGEEVAR